MAFKKLNEYVEEKQGAFFALPNDGDSADVIFLYRSTDDVLVADVHYISSKNFNGYAHCLGDNCPACNYPTKSGRGIRKQSQLFIPLYNITKRKVEFWDRTPRFEQVLHQSVFKNYPNPSEYVFRVTRHGQPRDPATRYEIRATSRNADYSYDQILADFNMTMPDSYSMVCKELTYTEMQNYLTSDAPTDLPDYGYVPVPCGSNVTSGDDLTDTLPEISVPTPEYSAPPADLAPVSDELPFVPVAPADPVEGSTSESDEDIDDVKF